MATGIFIFNNAFSLWSVLSPYHFVVGYVSGWCGDNTDHRLKRQFSALKSDIAENGIKEPLSYVEHDGGKYVVDGHHRLRAAKELGHETVPAKQVQLPHKGYKTADDLIYTRH